jgi:hypothetical protein
MENKRGGEKGEKAEERMRKNKEKMLIYPLNKKVRISRFSGKITDFSHLFDPVLFHGL